MDDEDFEQLVNAGIEAIPKKFLDLLNNVAIVIEQEPTTEQLIKLQLHKGWTLFGLYEGVPQNKRGANYTAVLPDKITIFRGPILRSASNPEQIKEMVKNTVWHEKEKGKREVDLDMFNHVRYYVHNLTTSSKRQT